MLKKAAKIIGKHANFRSFLVGWIGTSPNIVFLYITIVFFSTCENDMTEINKAISKEQIKVETAHNVELLYSDSAVVQVKVTGPKMLRHLDKNTPTEEFPEGIRVDFLNKNKRSTSKLTAKYAIRYESKNEIIVRDSVIWNSGKGEKLETEELVWNDKKKKMSSKKFVKITKPDEVIYGYGFEADQEFNRWEIIQVTGQIKVEGLDN